MGLYINQIHLSPLYTLQNLRLQCKSIYWKYLRPTKRTHVKHVAPIGHVICINYFCAWNVHLWKLHISAHVMRAYIIKHSRPCGTRIYTLSNVRLRCTSIISKYFRSTTRISVRYNILYVCCAPMFKNIFVSAVCTCICYASTPTTQLYIIKTLSTYCVRTYTLQNFCAPIYVHEFVEPGSCTHIFLYNFVSMLHAYIKQNFASVWQPYTSPNFRPRGKYLCIYLGVLSVKYVTYASTRG